MKQTPIVFDLEADSLDATKIHCVSYQDSKGKIHTLTTYDEMREFFLSEDVFVGHNIARYDIPTVERILNIELKNKKIVDTLALSWYIYSKRALHGLESWGEDFGIHKLKIDDWENLELEEYVARCERDVKINVLLWNQQFSFLKRLYESEAKAWRFIAYLSFKMECAALQEASRWKLDVERCETGVQELEKIKSSKIEELKKIMPDVPKYTKRTKPKKPYKQDGTLSEAGKRWFEEIEKQKLHPETTEELKVLSSYEEPKPTSSQQIKALLFDMGWTPDEFKYVKDDKEDSGTRRIPQVNTQVPGEWGLSQSVKNLVEAHPELEPLDGLTVVSHRLSILKGFMEAVDSEGYIKAEIQGLTNTLRFKHKVAVNLPTPATPYGGLVRGCLVAPEGYELCGSDQSSLEDKCKQHYIYDYDPEYVEEMQTPGFDPHLDLAIRSGALTKEQSDAFKADELPFKEKTLVKKIRSVYKTTNYACVYGAGGPKIALSAGVPKARGYELHEAYWKRNWAVKAVADACVIKVCGGQKWLYNPISKFWYELRAEKDRFSTLNQSTGVYCFDTWIKFVLSKRRQLTAQFHDEIVLTIKKGSREACEKLLRWAEDKTNERIGLRVKLDIDVQFGKDYSQIH